MSRTVLTDFSQVFKFFKIMIANQNDKVYLLLGFPHTFEANFRISKYLIGQ